MLTKHRSSMSHPATSIPKPISGASRRDTRASVSHARGLFSFLVPSASKPAVDPHPDRFAVERSPRPQPSPPMRDQRPHPNSPPSERAQDPAFSSDPRHHPFYVVNPDPDPPAEDATHDLGQVSDFTESVSASSSPSSPPHSTPPTSESLHEQAPPEFSTSRSPSIIKRKLSKKLNRQSDVSLNPPPSYEAAISAPTPKESSLKPAPNPRLQKLEAASAPSPTPASASASTSASSTPAPDGPGSSRASLERMHPLDRIDELDETNPLGLAVHHDGPYEAIQKAIGPAVGARGHPSNRPKQPPPMQPWKPPVQQNHYINLAGPLNLAPGQVLPRNFGLYPTAVQQDPHPPLAPRSPEPARSPPRRVSPPRTDRPEFDPYAQPYSAPQRQPPPPHQQHSQPQILPQRRLQQEPRVQSPPQPQPQPQSRQHLSVEQAVSEDNESVYDIAAAYGGIEEEEAPPAPAPAPAPVQKDRPIPAALQAGGPPRSRSHDANHRVQPANGYEMGGSRSQSVPPEQYRRAVMSPSAPVPPIPVNVQRSMTQMQRPVQTQQQFYQQPMDGHGQGHMGYLNVDPMEGRSQRSAQSSRAPSVQQSVNSTASSRSGPTPTHVPQHLVMPAPLQQSQYANSQAISPQQRQQQQQQPRLPPQFNTHYKPSPSVPPPPQTRTQVSPTPPPAQRPPPPAQYRPEEPANGHKLLRKRTNIGKGSDSFAPSAFAAPPPPSRAPNAGIPGWSDFNRGSQIYADYSVPSQPALGRAHTTATPGGKSKKVLSKRRSHL